jgi:hypothetical protein
MLHRPNDWAPTFPLHVQDPPKITPLPVILCSSVTTPPVLISFPVLTVLHVGSQDSWDSTLTTRDT